VRGGRNFNHWDHLWHQNAQDLRYGTACQPVEKDGSYNQTSFLQTEFSPDCARKMNKLLTTVFALAVASVTATSFAEDLKGDAKAGEKANAMCIGCHGIIGYQASFPEVYKVPKISGQNAKYIASALAQYKAGDRKHPTMRAIAESLSEQDMANLAAYYSTHGGEPVKQADTPTAVPGPKAATLMKAANCASCHGANFTNGVDGSFPKLAGQHKDYLLIAAKAYLNPDKATFGRTHAAMGGLLKAQRDVGPHEFQAQLNETMDYLSKLPGDLKTIPESRFR
jgi:cytochrome c553